MPATGPFLMLRGGSTVGPIQLQQFLAYLRGTEKHLNRLTFKIEDRQEEMHRVVKVRLPANPHVSRQPEMLQTCKEDFYFCGV